MSATPASDAGAKPELPPNVLIFAPKKPAGADALLHGRLFTRLATTASTDPVRLAAAVRKADAEGSFCLAFRGGVLLFDGAAGAGDGDEIDDDTTNAHHEHFRAVCLALKDADIDLDVAGCIFDARGVLKAGFQLDVLRPGNVLVIDLMGGEDEDSDDDDEDAEASLAALVGGSETTLS